MKRLVIRLFACAAGLSTAAAWACDYTAGETKFADYATCRYGEDSVVVVNLPEDSGWEQCVYYAEAFRPAKLLAITRMEDGKEIASLNNRSQIGNHCYLSKQKCDLALKAMKSAGY